MSENPAPKSAKTQSSRGTRSRGKNKSIRRPYVRRRWYRRPKLLAAIFGGLTLIFLVSYAPAKAMFNRYRFEKTLTEGQAALEKGRRMDVDRAIVRAWNYSNKSTEQVSELFNLAAPIRSNQTVHLAQFLLKTDDAPIEDYATALDALARSRYQNMFQDAFDQLPKEVRDRSEIKFSYVRFLGYNDRALEAIPLAEELIEESNLPKIRLALIDLYTNAGKDSRYQNLAARLIRSILDEGDTPEAAQALPRVFKLREPLSHFRPEYLENWLENSSGDFTEEWFILQSLLLKDTYPELQKRKVREIFDRYKESHPGLVARFVVHFNGTALLEELPKDVVETDPVIYTAYLGHQFDLYFAALERDEEQEAAKHLARADELLENAPDSIGRPLVESCRAAIATLEGEPSEAEYYRQRALRAAQFEGSFGQFFEILRIADRFGDTITAREAVLVIAGQTTKFLPDADKLDFFEKYLTSESDLQLLKDLYGRLNASRPDDLEAALKLSTILVTTGGDLDRAEAVIAPWKDGSKRRISIDALRALIHLEREESEQAVELLDRPAFNFFATVPDIDRAIFATVMFKSGEVAVAESVQAKVDWSRIPSHLYEHLKKHWPTLPKRETRPVREG